MTLERPASYWYALVKELCALTSETEWCEFKVDNSDPKEIGEYISALANAATLASKVHAYLVWGVEDTTHRVVGTSFVPAQAKKGNEELENWLLRKLSPKIGFQFRSVNIDGRTVVVLEIERSARQPVQFEGGEWIRIGSYKKKLKDFPEKERALWRAFDATPIEAQIAHSDVRTEDVVRLLDYPRYFDLVERPLPETRALILDTLKQESFIVRDDAGHWNITNLGALLFAKRLSDFPRVKRKAVRVVVYRGRGRVEAIREQEIGRGYAAGFEGLVGFVNELLPTNEVIQKALRRDVPMYPEIAIREVVANALIHQDLTVRGAGPTVEIFDDRMEVTSPGEPLMPTDRFLDTPPRSRNEALASFMRRVGVCEERGSGIDKVVSATETFQLPAPLFEVTGGSTRVVLFGARGLAEMDSDDRIRACYQHACLRYVMREFMTNSSVRERFGIASQNSAKASRLIKEAVESGKVEADNADASRKHMKYVPFWAKEVRSR